MEHGRLDHLERLHKLRKAGALDDEEFQAEKRKLFADDGHVGRFLPHWWTYGLTAAAVLIGAVLIGVWTSKKTLAPPQKTSASSKIPTSAPTSHLAVPAPPVRSSAKRLADAFEAATGHRTAFTKTEAGDVIITKPLRIVELPFGPALLTKQEIKDGCHACTGAIGVFYLKEEGGTTSVTGRWPKAVEGWGWGAAPTEWYLTDKFTTYPAVYASGGFMGQGVIEESATITELRPQGPVTSDVVGTGFSDEGAIVDNERPACIVKGMIANVHKDVSFDVIVSGSIHGRDRYIKRSGRFVAASKRDWGVPCGE